MGLAQDHAGLLRWKTEVEDSLGDLASMIKLALRREESKRLELVR